jgi:redox-sensitive bicupin YhaK (pirin superfamily)
MITLHKADSRGHANHGWLDSWHSFSFGGYYNPERIHFGALRVLNDDTVSGGMGFGKHPHDNMEIISIALEGELEHRDSMGNVAVIREGDVQVMSAGTGIYHSEYNKNSDRLTRFLQIWVFPNKRNVTPRYDQISLDSGKLKNNLFQILSPNEEDDGVWIHQDAWFSMGNFDAEHAAVYTLKKAGNGIYVFIIEGEWTLQNQKYSRRDGIAFTDTDILELQSESDNARILIMEVPMQL